MSCRPDSEHVSIGRLCHDRLQAVTICLLLWSATWQGVRTWRERKKYIIWDWRHALPDIIFTPRKKRGGHNYRSALQTSSASPSPHLCRHLVVYLIYCQETFFFSLDGRVLDGLAGHATISVFGGHGLQQSLSRDLLSIICPLLVICKVICSGLRARAMFRKFSRECWDRNSSPCACLCGRPTYSFQLSYLSVIQTLSILSWKEPE